MKKAILTAAALIAISTTAQAKEINLECAYTGVDGDQKSKEIVINTDLGTGTDTFGQGILITKADTYEFTVHSSIGSMKTTIGRNDLSYKHEFLNELVGSCKVVESKAKI